MDLQFKWKVNGDFGTIAYWATAIQSLETRFLQKQKILKYYVLKIQVKGKQSFWESSKPSAIELQLAIVWKLGSCKNTKWLLEFGLT